MGLESHGIFVPGHKSRDLGLGLGLILLGRLGLRQMPIPVRDILKQNDSNIFFITLYAKRNVRENF